MKPAALKPDTYIDFDVEFNAIKAKMKIGHNVTLTKCKNLSARGYQQNCLEKAFAIKSLEDATTSVYVIADLNSK